MCHYMIEVWHFKLALGPGASFYDTWFNSKLVTILEGYGLCLSQFILDQRKTHVIVYVYGIESI